jgi:hypothetical protein
VAGARRAGNAHPHVDAFIDRLRAWQRAICQQVHELAHAADLEVQETIKRTSQPYCIPHGNIAALLATKDHLNVFPYDPTVPTRTAPSTRARTPWPHSRSKSTIKTPSTRPRCNAMFPALIANNRAGGWRRLTKAPAAQQRYGPIRRSARGEPP